MAGRQEEEEPGQADEQFYIPFAQILLRSAIWREKSVHLFLK